MKVTAFNDFVCPIDGLALVQGAKALSCRKGHVFDLAREGYCNLLLVQQKGSLDPGDNKEMVAARRRFLDGGYFEPIADKLFAMIPREKNLRIVDAGCGEGYYLNRLSESAKWDKRSNSLALAGCDVSKWAVKAAAKRFPDIAWTVAGNKHLPFAPGSVDLIVSMFGYPDWKNFKPLLSQAGCVLLVDPGPQHLIELREIIYPEVNVNDAPSTNAAIENGYILKREEPLRFSVGLSHTSIQDLLAMTPHAFRIKKEARQRLQALKQLTVTVEVIFRILQVG